MRFWRRHNCLWLAQLSHASMLCNILYKLVRGSVQGFTLPAVPGNGDDHDDDSLMAFSVAIVIPGADERARALDIEKRRGGRTPKSLEQRVMTTTVTTTSSTTTAISNQRSRAHEYVYGVRVSCASVYVHRSTICTLTHNDKMLNDVLAWTLCVCIMKPFV